MMVARQATKSLFTIDNGTMQDYTLYCIRMQGV